jgi:hypothetical protein
VVGEDDGAVDQLGEGRVEDDVLDAVVVELQFGEEGLDRMECPAPRS